MFLAEGFDLDVNTRRKIEFHQRIDSLLRGFENVEQTLVCANLELLARLLVHVRGAQYAVFIFHRGQWDRARDLRAGTLRRIDDLTRRLIEDAVIVCLETDANSFFSNHVWLSNPSRLIREERSGGMLQVADCFMWCAGTLARETAGLHPLADFDNATYESSYFRRNADTSVRATRSYCTISLIVPAPTVCPPSRMAKRRPFSMATGVISSITSCTLSPGITISVPEGSSATPVTSVVRR